MQLSTNFFKIVATIKNKLVNLFAPIPKEVTLKEWINNRDFNQVAANIVQDCTNKIVTVNTAQWVTFAANRSNFESPIPVTLSTFKIQAKGLNILDELPKSLGNYLDESYSIKVGIQ